MRNRNCWIWIVFASCACLVAAAMFWLTRSVISTEHNRAIAEIRAELQERVRLSLWQMDSLGTSILIEENAIPTQLFLSEPETTLPTTARFETQDGAAIRGTGSESALTFCSTAVPGLVSKKETSLNQSDSPGKSQAYDAYVAPPQSKLRGGEKMQVAANLAEKANRSRWLGEALSKQNITYGSEKKDADQKRAPAPTPSDREIPNPISDFKPAWYDGSLFLIRRGMTITTFAQGSLVDEDKLKELLLTECRQRLPQAYLERAQNEQDDSFILASFPFKLTPGGIGATPESIPRTISISLFAGWIAALVALLTAFFLISNIMKLSDRRASFVSAVTHELRTPLTTFRLYSDMLSTGAVREEKRPAYLNVLSREADRLSHLVENVLAFSKIERGSARSTVSEVELNQTLESMRERFESRLDTACLRLDFQPTDPLRITLDTSALEHILFNLIDNAAKYAAASDPPVVSLKISVKSGDTEICVCDHGPGISGKECKRIFRPFHKSAKEAAETQPGVGLGLALSSRLARSMGGQLSCRKRPDGSQGAIFALTLPQR